MIALLRLVAGLVLWAVVFSLVYGLHGIGCSAGWAAMPALGTSVHRLVLLAAWAGGALVALALALVLQRRPAIRPDREAGPAIAGGIRAVAWIGLAATVVGGLPILLVPDCL